MTNNSLPYSENLSTTNNTSLLENKQNIDHEVIDDERRMNFYMIDNDFIDAGFDVYTVSLYNLIVRRAQNSVQGFFENRATTAKHLGMGKEAVLRCRDLLAFCNIIKIYNRKNTLDSADIAPRIVLVDKKFWRLNHDFRNATKLYQGMKKGMIARPVYPVEYVEIGDDRRVKSVTAVDKHPTPRRLKRLPPVVCNDSPPSSETTHKKNPYNNTKNNNNKSVRTRTRETIPITEDILIDRDLGVKSEELLKSSTPIIINSNNLKTGNPLLNDRISNPIPNTLITPQTAVLREDKKDPFHSPYKDPNPPESGFKTLASLSGVLHPKILLDLLKLEAEERRTA